MTKRNTITGKEMQEFCNLIINSSGGCTEALRYIEDIGVDVNAKASDGHTLMHTAAHLGSVNAIMALKAAGAHMNERISTDNSTAAHLAAQNGHSAAITTLKTLGENMDAQMLNGTRPVHLAVQKAHVEVITALKAAGANMDAQTKAGVTATYIAANLGYAKVIGTLKAAGANVDIPMPDTKTPLHVAAAHGYVEVIHTLKDAGANIEAEMWNGATAVHVATANGRAEAIGALKTAGANVNKAMADGKTALFLAVSGGDLKVVTALLEVGADLAMKVAGVTPLEKARQLMQDGKSERYSEIVTLFEAREKELQRLEEKKKKEQQKHENAEKRELEKKIKSDQQAEIMRREEVRKLFFDSLQIKLSLLAVKNQEIKALAEKRKVYRADIFVQTSAIADVLEHTLEGNPNIKRLSLLTNNSIHLEKACDLNDKIKAKGKEVLAAINDFEQLINGLKGELSESERTFLETKYEWFSKACEALMDEANDAKNELLNTISPYIQQEWNLLEEKHKALLELVGQLSSINNNLSIQMEDMKGYRRENAAIPKKENFNKRRSLTQNDLDKIQEIVTEIRKKIAAQKEGDLKAAQEAQERARQLKKAMALRSVKKSSIEPLGITVSPIDSRSASVDLTVGTQAPLNVVSSRSERRMSLSIAYAADQRNEEKKILQDIRCLYVEETADAIVKGLYPRPLPRHEEVKVSVEQSDLLRKELGILHSVVNLLGNHNEWTPEMRYALLGSFARVNEIIGKECKDIEIIKIAKRLRNVIFKHYEIVQTKRYSDSQWLGIVKEWIRFYEKPKLGMFDTEKGVLAEVNSPLLSSFYEDTSILKREMHIIDFSNYRACLAEMQQYFESRNKEDDNVIAYAANFLFLGVTGATFKALRTVSKDNPKAMLVMREFELLNIYAPQIVVEGADARHPKGDPVLLYLQGLRARSDMNVHYEYEDNDMQAILMSRLQHLRKINTSEATALCLIRVLAAVDNLGFKQLETRLEEDKKLNADMGARTVLIPCNLGNAHWVGICLQFNTSGQVLQALYIDSVRQNTTIPSALQKQLQIVYPTAVFERRALMTQADGTSCGPYAIENLLLCAQNLPANTLDARAIRQLHLEALKTYRPDFYSAFNERQKTNTPTTASLEKQLGYVDKLKKVVFSKDELYRIVCIKSCLSRLSKKSELALLQVFGDQSAAEFNHTVHLTLIRSVLEQNIKTADVFDVEHVKALAELLELLCGIKDWRPSTVLPTNLDFKVGYEEILAVANISCTSEQVVSTQQSVVQQIEWDRQFALQLQNEFSNNVGTRKKDIVSYT